MWHQQTKGLKNGSSDVTRNDTKHVTSGFDDGGWRGGVRGGGGGGACEAGGRGGGGGGAGEGRLLSV